MPKWEYEHTLLMDVLTYGPILDRYGAHGWELVSAVQVPEGIRCFFKRPLITDTAPAIDAVALSAALAARQRGRGED